MTIKAVILDCETTGTGKTAQVIELACLGLPELDKMHSQLYKTPISLQFEQRYKPTVPINPEAQKVHGISKAELQKCPSTQNILNDYNKHFPEVTFWIGHKIDFDRRMMLQSAEGDLSHIKLICTHALAVRLLPERVQEELPNLKLITICQHYYPELVADILEEGHSALGDCALVLMLLDVLVKRTSALSWEDLHALCIKDKKPATKSRKKGELAILECWPPFGKHKLKSFSEIPKDYLLWARDNLDFARNESLLFTINHWLK